jgi:serine/threonine protein kinase
MNTNWVDTQELLTATFQQPAGQREQFVREHCADPVLRDTLAALVSPALSEGGAGREDSQPEILSGAHVGPYIVLHRLGRGGMGEVFLGRDPRLDRSVALKCLLLSHGGGEDHLRAHVIREARAAARITHANVAAVYDVVEHEGRAFIVMEYVEGESLAALLRRGALAPERIVALGSQIADALTAAHAGGIVHRDLKPANIHVRPDGSIKILDFGIATALASLATARGAATTVAETCGARAGTPAYMAPEQLLGQPVDARSDLFSLAAILFEMATGRRVFASNEPLAVLLAAVGTLPRADDIDARVPPEIADVIARGLATDPANRFQSAGEFKAALDAVRDRLFSTGAARTVLQPVARRSWRERVVRALAVALLSPIILWALGRLSSAAFNNTLGRAASFAAEPPLQYVVWGAKSLVAPFGYAAIAIVTVWTALFVMRLLILSPALAQLIGRADARRRALSARLSLADPIVLAQGLTTLGAAAIAAIAWRFNLLIQAWGSSISVAPAELLWRLGPANESEKVLYRAALTVLFLAFGAGLIRVVKLRVAQRVRHGGAVFVALVIVVTSLLLLNEAPYRILWKNDAPRVQYQGAQCYVIGEDAARWLLFCPQKEPPRNRVVSRAEPGIRQSGEIENIFTLMPTPAR